MSKEKEEKDKASEVEKETPEVKAEGSEGKTESEEDKSKCEAAGPTVFDLSPSFSVILTGFFLFLLQPRREKKRRQEALH